MDDAEASQPLTSDQPGVPLRLRDEGWEAFAIASQALILPAVSRVAHVEGYLRGRALDQ
jgi:hypothetical protein